MAAVLFVVGLLVAGGLAVGVISAARIGRTHVGAVAQARRAAVQVEALNASLAITRTQYDAERALWEAALQHPTSDVRR